MMSTIRRASLLSAVACVTLTAAGCIGSDDPNDGSSISAQNSTAAPTPAESESAVGGPRGALLCGHRPHPETNRSVLIVGIAPEAVDLTDPSLPPGLTVEIIRQGLVNAQAEIAAAGDHADLCMIQPDATAEATVHGCFATHPDYDAVVVGAGIRLPPNNLILFENVINTIHRDARFAAIAFNVNPADSAAAAERVLAKFR